MVDREFYNKPRFANIDLHIISVQSLDKITSALKKFKINCTSNDDQDMIDKNGMHFRNFEVDAELPEAEEYNPITETYRFYRKPQDILNHFCTAIETFEETTKNVWDNAVEKIFDFGFSSGLTKHIEQEQVTIPTELIQRCAAIGATVRITLYSTTEQEIKSDNQTVKDMMADVDQEIEWSEDSIRQDDEDPDHPTAAN